MKIALCLSGELRKATLFYPIIKKHIIDRYDIDIFMSTWKLDTNIPTSRANTNRNPLEMTSIEDAYKIYQPTGIYIQEYSLDIKHRLMKISKTPHDNLLCMTYHIYKSNNLANDREFLTNVKYDIVIRSRFDFAINYDIKFEEYDMNQINILNEHGYGGYQDMFAFGNSKVISIYSNWFFDLKDKQSKHNIQTDCLFPAPHTQWHPETMLKKYLDTSNTKVNLINIPNTIYPWCSSEDIIKQYDKTYSI